MYHSMRKAECNREPAGRRGLFPPPGSGQGLRFRFGGEAIGQNARAGPRVVAKRPDLARLRRQADTGPSHHKILMINDIIRPRRLGDPDGPRPAMERFMGSRIHRGPANPNELPL